MSLVGNLEIIDLRSDTVTLPTQEMLESIMNAKLGDDQYGEDETVNKLQEIASRKMGKEEALLVPSGTQANLVSLMSHTQRGNAAILEEESHMIYYEASGLSAIAGVMPIAMKGHLGALDAKKVNDRLKVQHRIHQPEIKIICLENTHNRAGGTCLRPEQIHEIGEVAQSNSIKLHMDGARIFNAAVALNIDVKKLTKETDSVTSCLSKSLSAPVGSMILGEKEFIEKTRINRQRVGGAMRHAGIIAAPGIVALEKMIDRLEEDHRNARRLAEGIAKIDGIQIDLSCVQTNIVCFEISGLGIAADLFISKLKEKDILALTLAENKVRMVTHKGIEKEHVEKSIAAIQSISNEQHLD